MNEDYGIYFPLCVTIFGEDDYSIYQNGKGGFEFQSVCPYCNKKKMSVNLDTGLVKCWSAKCPSSGKLGKFEYFLSDYKQIDLEEAREVVRDSVQLEDVLGLIEEREERTAKKAHELIHEESTILPPDAELYGKRSKTIAHWLMNLRNPGYTREEAMWIMDHFPFYHSKSFRMEDRALFEVTTLARKAYLAYHMHSGHKDVQKVMNPPGGVLSTMLLNYNETFNTCHGKTVYVCEGAFSMMRVLMTGRNAVACFGTNLSATQALLLSLLPAKRIVILFDHGAETKAARAHDYFASNYLVRSAWHTIEIDGMDPDDLGTEGCNLYLNELESGVRKYRYNNKGFNIQELRSEG